MKAKDVMTRHVIYVGQDEPLQRAVELMLNHRISGLPVVDDEGKLAGLLTEGDLLRRAETHTERKRPRWLEFLLGPGKLADEYAHSHGRQVSEVMSTEVISASPDAPLDKVVRLMERHHIKRVPIMKGKHLVGIISRANLVQALAAVMHDVPESSPSDAAISDLIWKEIDKQKWAPRSAIDLIVRNGYVRLGGVVMDMHEIEALTVLAENIPGVKTVENNIAWCDPMSGVVLENQKQVPGSDGAKKVGSIPA